MFIGQRRTGRAAELLRSATRRNTGPAGKDVAVLVATEQADETVPSKTAATLRGRPSCTDPCWTSTAGVSAAPSGHSLEATM
jgi:hypothetical protein